MNKYFSIPKPTAPLLGNEQILIRGRWVTAATYPAYDDAAEYQWRVPSVIPSSRIRWVMIACLIVACLEIILAALLLAGCATTKAPTLPAPIPVEFEQQDFISAKSH